MNEKLTIALTKGRILKETLPLLARAGIEPLEDVSSSRKLVFDTTSSDVQLVIIRGTDVPTYVRHGAADMGVVGKDILLEHVDELAERALAGVPWVGREQGRAFGWRPNSSILPGVTSRAGVCMPR